MVDAGPLVDLSSALRIDCRLSREAGARCGAVSGRLDGAVGRDWDLQRLTELSHLRDIRIYGFVDAVRSAKRPRAPGEG
jgi:hypothetical protein